MNGHMTDLFFSDRKHEPIQVMEKLELFDGADELVTRIAKQFQVTNARFTLRERDVALKMRVNSSFEDIVDFLGLESTNTTLLCYGPISGMYLLRTGA